MNDKVENPIQAADQNAAVLSIGGAAAAAGAPSQAGAGAAAQPPVKPGFRADPRVDAFRELRGRLGSLSMAQKAILGGGVLFFVLVCCFLFSQCSFSNFV